MLTGVVSRRPVRPLGDEARRPLPGDELVASPKLQWTHSITIRARPTEIWLWLVQMGCRRAGWYSYDGLDNGGVPSADRIIPGLQRAEVGDIFPWTPAADDGFVVRAVDPERALVVGDAAGTFTWALVLESLDETSTRLVTPRQGTVRAPRRRAAARTRLAPDPLRHAATATAQPKAARGGGGTVMPRRAPS